MCGDNGRNFRLLGFPEGLVVFGGSGRVGRIVRASAAATQIHISHTTLLSSEFSFPINGNGVLILNQPCSYVESDIELFEKFSRKLVRSIPTGNRILLVSTQVLNDKEDSGGLGGDASVSRHAVARFKAVFREHENRLLDIGATIVRLGSVWGSIGHSQVFKSGFVYDLCVKSKCAERQALAEEDKVVLVAAHPESCRAMVHVRDILSMIESYFNLEGGVESEALQLGYPVLPLREVAEAISAISGTRFQFDPSLVISTRDSPDTGEKYVPIGCRAPVLASLKLLYRNI